MSCTQKQSSLYSWAVWPWKDNDQGINMSLLSSFKGNELCTLTGHADRVTAVGIANNGLVVSASLDRTVKLWTPVVSNTEQVYSNIS